MSKRTIEHSDFCIERYIKASPATVFAYFSDIKKKRMWYGHDDDIFKIDSVEGSFAPQQFERWRFRVNNDPCKNDTCYINIVPNQRIVFVYTMEFGGQWVSSSHVTIELIADNGGTLLVHTEHGAFFDGCKHAPGRIEGTRGIIDKLASLAEQS